MPGMLPEAVAALANMLECAVVAGGVGAERGGEDHRVSSGAGGGRVLASVLAEAGARELPLDRAAVRAGRGGRPAGLGGGADRGRGRGSGDSGRFSDTQARKGYAQLVSRVCLGEVGAIFGLEVSRLARSNAETQRLLEFCALTDTLVIDTDGVYDLQNFNDRLLLGLKSQMSEAELHMITSRLQGAKRAAAERGELRFPLPVGYVHDDEGLTIIDPDEEVQAAWASRVREDQDRRAPRRPDAHHPPARRAPRPQAHPPRPAGRELDADPGPAARHRGDLRARASPPGRQRALRQAQHQRADAAAWTADWLVGLGLHRLLGTIRYPGTA